ncbi:TPA: hypothetical protein ACJIW2_004198 [Enterobacter roggenkampii]|uniref:hypothetical protein n=1 Tax=Enterobacter roggenkampii TaxID=1812935 RepID=UPI0020756754|nr:hypothetical protein [Enterobacter roggenkampii]MCM7722305.1 hypothetical protein [Enterobacter roggenkampii]
MSTISKERVKDILEFGAGRIISPITDDEIMELARIALASLEVEAVAYMYKDNLQSDARFSLHTRFGNWSQEDINEYEITEIPLYTAPPVPVSVPDDRYQNLSELYHAQEKRLFKLAQRIKGSSFDKYAYSPSQAIDVLESAIFGEREDDCRDAMLQGAEQPQNEQQNIPENIPATQFKSVADLYGLTSPTGGETSFTFDAVEARDFIDGGWSCQEYVQLERFQEAVSGNSPVIPDEALSAIRKVARIRADFDDFDGDRRGIGDCLDEAEQELIVTINKHASVIAAAPQQEVAQALAKGMERYGDAMQKLADSGD